MARGTAEERALSLSPDAVGHLKIEIQDADGTWRDYSHRNAGGRVSAHRDNPVMSATVRLQKASGEDSLSPLVEQSLQNRNAAGGFAPAADLSRLIRFSAATVPAGVPAVDAPGGDYRPIFEGRIDRVTQDDGDFLDVACSGKAIFIAQKQIREPATYGAPGGTLREVVVQQLLDANPNGKWDPAVVVGAATGSYLTPVEIPMGLTFDAARQLFHDIGWDLRERFDANGVLQLMAYYVDRNRVDVDAVIEAHQKYRLSRLDLDVEPIRTALRLWYRNAEGVLAFVEYENAAALADHGDRWAQIPEQLGIDTVPEAQTLVDTIGHDLSGPGAEFSAPIPFAWWIEVYDRLTFRGELLEASHHDADQTIALAGYDHVWDDQGALVTEVTGTVRIVGAYEAWRRRTLPQEAPTNAPVIEPRVMVDAEKLTADGYAKLSSPAGEQATLQVKLAETAGAAVWRLCAGAADPTPRYVASGTEVGPADWFTDGTSQQAVLAGVVLIREQIVRRYLQAVGRDSGLTSDWLPVPFDQRGTPWLESTDLTFDEATDELRLTVVAGAGCQSVRFELADNEAFAAPALNTVVPLGDGASAVQLLALAAAARGKIWYARATPYNGVNATGLAGGAQRASLQVSASESGGIAPPRVWLTENDNSSIQVALTVDGALGAGGTAPLEWQTKVWTDLVTEPAWPGAWNSAPLPTTVNVTRAAKWTKHAKARVRDAGGRITESEVLDIAPAIDFLQDNGRPTRGHPYDDGGYALGSSTATGKRAMVDVEDSRAALLNGMFRAGVDTTAGINGDVAGKRLVSDNERTGAGRGYTVIDAGNVIVAAGVDFSRAYTGKHAGNLPRSSTNPTAVSQAIGNLTDTGHAGSPMQDSRGALVNAMFRHGVDGPSGIVESTAQKFVHGDFLDASRRVRFIQSEATGVSVSGDSTYDAYQRAANAIRDYTGGLAAAATDSRSAAVNAMFRHGVDGASGVVESSAQKFVHGDAIDSNRRIGRIEPTATLGNNAGATLTKLAANLQGAQLNANPDFAVDLTGYYVYDNAASGRISLSRVQDAAFPNTTGFGMRVSYSASAAQPSPGMGGFYYPITLLPSEPQRPGYYRYDAEIMMRVVAKLPSGYTLGFASNSIGSEATTQAIDTPVGDGVTFKTYLWRIKIGVTGTFSSTGYFYLSGPANSNAFSWDVAVVDYIDINQAPVLYGGTQLRYADTGARPGDDGIFHGRGGAADSRGATLNGMFRHGIDNLGGVADGGGFKRITDQHVDNLNRVVTVATPAGDRVLGVNEMVANFGADASNMLANGGFQETAIGGAITGWTYAAGNTMTAQSASKMGDRAAFVSHATALYSYSYQDFGYLYAGFVYELGLWVYPENWVDAGGVTGALLAIVGNEGNAGTWTILGKVSDPHNNAGNYAGAVVDNASGNVGWVFVKVIARLNVSGTARVYLVHGFGGALTGAAYFDGVYVRKVDDGTVSVGGARGRKGLTDDGEIALPLPPGLGQRDGVTVRVLAKGHLAGTAAHGAAVVFPVNFQNPPLVLIRGGANIEPSAINWVGTYSGTARQYDDVAALNLSAGGFEMRARLRQKSGVTVHTHNFGANSLTAEGQSVERNLDNAPASDDRYAGRFRVDLTANAASGAPRNEVSVTVAVDINKGSGFTECATKTFLASAAGSPVTQSFTNEELIAVMNAVPNTGDIRIRIKDFTTNPGTGGGSVTVHAFDGAGGDPRAGVSYATATNAYAQKTVDADDVMYWEAIEVS